MRTIKFNLRKRRKKGNNRIYVHDEPIKINYTEPDPAGEVITRFPTKVRFLGQDNPVYFLHGKVYEVIDCEKDSDFYRIIDETGEDYLYTLTYFEILDDEEKQAP